MTKVKLTQEQADAIERLKKNHRDEIERFKRNPGYFADWLIPLKNMEVDEIEKSYREGYEVEPEFKVGDWVKTEFRDGSYAIGRIDTLAFDDVIFNYYNENREINRLRRHKGSVTSLTDKEIAEEKTRRFFAENDREPWVLKIKDLIDINDSIESISSIEDEIYFFETGNYALPEDMELLIKKGNVKVVCFAEGRKDIEVSK